MPADVRKPGSHGQFDVVDALAVVGPYRDRRPDTPFTFEELLDEHHRYGIGRRLVLHAESRDGVPDQGNENIQRQTFLRDDTAVIWTALPQRRFGAPRIDVFLGDAERAGVAMLALFPDTHGHHIAPWANEPLYKAMQAARLPLLLDLANAQGAEARHRYEDVHAVATAFPHLPIVLWNAFYMDERLQIPLLDACRNVRVGLATVFIPSFGIEQYTARYGPDRLVFGSNWPRQSPGPLLTYVLYADVHDRVKHAILGDTIRALVADVRWPVAAFPKKAKAKTEATRPTQPTGPTDAAAPGEAEAPAEASDQGPTPTGDADAAPWLAAMAELEARVRRGGAGAIDREEPDAAGLDPHRAPGEEGE